jgi:hypothetical protein
MMATEMRKKGRMKEAMAAVSSRITRKKNDDPNSRMPERQFYVRASGRLKLSWLIHLQ